MSVTEDLPKHCFSVVLVLSISCRDRILQRCHHEQLKSPDSAVCFHFASHSGHTLTGTPKVKFDLYCLTFMHPYKVDYGSIR